MRYTDVPGEERHSLNLLSLLDHGPITIETLQTGENDGVAVRNTEAILLCDLLEQHQDEFEDSLASTLEKLLSELYLRRKGEWQ